MNNIVFSFSLNNIMLSFSIIINLSTVLNYTITNKVFGLNFYFAMFTLKSSSRGQGPVPSRITNTLHYSIPSIVVIRQALLSPYLPSQSSQLSMAKSTSYTTCLNILRTAIASVYVLPSNAIYHPPHKLLTSCPAPQRSPLSQLPTLRLHLCQMSSSSQQLYKDMTSSSLPLLLYVPLPTFPMLCSNHTFCWLTKASINMLVHSKHGNRLGKVTLATGYWNWAKGLLDGNNIATPKLDEIELFINSHQLDILDIAEAGLHGVRSRTVRALPVSTNSILTALRIPGFTIILPESWEQHNTARIFMYVKDTLVYKVISTSVNVSDLPTITIEVRKGKSAPTVVSSHYREFTGGVSGLNSQDAQLGRLVRHTELWRQLHRL